MKVLAICGSPRRQGNTAHALDALLEALKGHADVEKLSLRDLTIKPCIACYKCAGRRACVLEDDMEPIYRKFDEADVIILASPMCFTNVNAQIKALIDRCQAIYVSKYIRKKPIIDTAKRRAGCFICTTGEKGADTAGILLTAGMFFKAVNAKHVVDLIFDGTDDAPVAARPDAADRAAQAAQALLGYLD